MSGAAVRITVDVALDPAAAFDAFTAEIDSWWVRDRHSWHDPDRAVGIRFEPGVGGRLVEVHDRATGDGVALAVVVVWQPGERLMFRDADRESPQEVEVRFDAVETGTRVTLEHRGVRLPAGAHGRMPGPGWWLIARWFDRYVTVRREPVPDQRNP